MEKKELERLLQCPREEEGGKRKQRKPEYWKQKPGGFGKAGFEGEEGEQAASRKGGGAKQAAKASCALREKE